MTRNEMKCVHITFWEELPFSKEVSTGDLIFWTVRIGRWISIKSTQYESTSKCQFQKHCLVVHFEGRNLSNVNIEPSVVNLNLTNLTKNLNLFKSLTLHAYHTGLSILQKTYPSRLSTFKKISFKGSLWTHSR